MKKTKFVKSPWTPKNIKKVTAYPQDQDARFVIDYDYCYADESTVESKSLNGIYVFWDLQLNPTVYIWASWDIQ